VTPASASKIAPVPFDWDRQTRLQDAIAGLRSMMANCCNRHVRARAPGIPLYRLEQDTLRDWPILRVRSCLAEKCRKVSGPVRDTVVRQDEAGARPELARHGCDTRILLEPG
jgi:hypothetical protein